MTLGTPRVVPLRKVAPLVRVTLAANVRQLAHLSRGHYQLPEGVYFLNTHRPEWNSNQ